MENKKDYDKLYDIFISYKDKEWHKLITNVLEFSPLDLPIIIDTELPQETFIFINLLLQKKNSRIADYFSKQLVDYYTALASIESNMNSFIILNWVFSVIKPTSYRYALETKFTKEDFLNGFENEIGEKLQLSLLSVISSLRFISNEHIRDSLFNTQEKYSSDLFILVSLRYFYKSEDETSYYYYLESLISKKLNKTNAPIFVEALKEFVFKNKSYQPLYNWLINPSYKRNDNFFILKDEMLKWINYDNVDIKSYSNDYCEFVFFELVKEKLVPCITIKNLTNKIIGNKFFEKELKLYFEFITNSLNKSSNKNNLNPYRFKPKIGLKHDFVSKYNEYLTIDTDFISKDAHTKDEFLKKISFEYKISSKDILATYLTEVEYDMIYNFMKVRNKSIF